MKTVIFKNERGYFTDDGERIHVFRKGKRDYDGFIEDEIYHTYINYKTGLYQNESCRGYFAKYIDDYKDKQRAIDGAKLELGVRK